MLPPVPMRRTSLSQASRTRWPGARAWTLLWTACVALVFAGCTPAGPASLLEGRKLLQRGQPRAAILPLHDAVQLMRTNGLAWGYLGLAYHQTGDFTNAATCYVQALRWDRDLVDVRYNLGEAWLALGRPEAAKLELIAFTVQRPGHLNGWVARGTAELRNKEPAAAANSFATALRLSPTNVTALNNLGVALVQRGRAKEAEPYFVSATQQQPAFSPALRNLAIVQQQHLRDLPAARQTWRQYAALTPPPADAEAVARLIAALELPPPPAVATNLVPAPPPETPVPTPLPAVPVVAAPPATSAPPVTEAAPAPVTTVAPPRRGPPAQPPPVTPAPRTAPPAQPAAPPVAIVSTPVPIVTAPPLDPAPPAAPPATSAPPVTASPPSTSATPVTAEAAAEEARRGFLAKINPANLFKRKPKEELRPTRLPEAGATMPTAPPPSSTVASEIAPTAPAPPPETRPAPPPPLILPEPRPPLPEPPPARYTYVRPAVPGAGNRAEANRAFRAGIEAQQQGRVREAVTDYQQATRADPQFFEAWNNLGLATHETGRLEQSLRAFEMALALRPDSAEARYNFAVALRDAGYPRDAASEFQQVLVTHPADIRAHLALGNLYSQRLGDISKARAHYRRVLELDPNHPQAPSIRAWLRDHPG